MLSPTHFPRKDFPLVWDNTMRIAFVECPRKFFYAYYHGYQPARLSVHLHAGAAFAKGVEAVRKAYYGEGVTADTALSRGVAALILAYGDFDPGNSVKTCERMVGALGYYFARYPLASDNFRPLITSNGPAVEFNFALPIDVKHPQTGEPIIYCGRFDMLATLFGEENNLHVTDEKTTTQLGPTWPKKWELRSQFIGYTWGARQYGYPVKAALVRGISILKNSYGDAQALVAMPDFKIEAWYTQLCRDITRAIKCWEEDYFDQNFGESCNNYGSCPYMQLCQVEHPHEWLNPDYTIRVWDPMGMRGGADE